ncbi:unnamed protein product [Prorocentrum cordatum]|uniref:Uncharacterized protein n=1 Tax=Prorocentrum cordatum TaxID=2364126 RepID=A0ABN9UJB9_9DINO|nr:unnamed protein product [Polarella glacialis]
MNRCWSSRREGKELEEFQTVTRLGKATRLLSLKNTDCKIVAAMGNSLMKPIIAKSAHHAQNGFLPNWQFIEHVVMMDAQARIVAMTPKELERDPLMMMFDFGNAFPSMCRNFLSQVWRLPSQYLNMVDAIYMFPLAWTILSGTMQVSCWLASGILQGCPWSGALLAAGVDPYHQDLFHRTRHFKQRVIAVCADDVGAVLPIRTDDSPTERCILWCGAPGAPGPQDAEVQDCTAGGGVLR